MTDHTPSTVAPLVVYSIGHSTHEPDRFIELLRQHRIEALADVRSEPHSRHAPQFNQGSLQALLGDSKIGYEFFGESLGGRPKGKSYYDESGRVLYDRVADSAAFVSGVARLIEELSIRSVVIMCAEENPLDCHRRLLIARVLETKSISVRHIRGSGSVETEDDLRRAKPTPAEQTELFDEGEVSAWRSTRSVLRAPPRPSSSEH